MKRFTERNSRRYNGQQPATKSARGPGDKPMMNRESTAGFVPPPAYLKFPLFVLARRRSEQLFMVPWRTTETVGFGADRIVRTRCCPAYPAPPSAVHRVDRI